MTVKELIEELQKMPQDAEVIDSTGSVIRKLIVEGDWVVMEIIE